MRFLSLTTVIKKVTCIFLLVLLSIPFTSKACSPINVPSLLGQTVTPGVLSLDWQSTTVWFSCGDVIDIEIACATGTFSGSSADTFTSAAMTLSANPQTFPTMTVDISGLCPGLAYQYRARQRIGGQTTCSSWSSILTFTAPGVFVPPTLVILPSQNVVCPGQSALLTSFNSGCSVNNATFIWTPTLGLSCFTCSAPAASPSVSTTYSCYADGGQLGCWTATASVLITVANPTVTVNTPTICPGQTATLVANGAAYYYWSTGSFPTGPSTGGAGPTVTTEYTVTGNTSGCTSIAVATVVVTTPPVVIVNNPVTCIGQTIPLTSTGGGTYLWQGPLGFTSTQQNPNIPNASIPMSGSYSVLVTSPLGCTNSAVSNVVVPSTPTPVVTSNNPVCLNSVLTFTGSSATTFTWTGPNNYTSTAQDPNIGNVSNAAAGIYTVIGAIGTCTGSATFSVTIKPLPVASAQNNGPVCAGATISFTGSGGASYVWHGPANFNSAAQNPSINTATASNTGPYTLIVTGANSCIDSVITQVVVDSLPVISGSNLSVCFNQPIFLSASGGQTFSWQGPGFFTSSLQNPVIPNANYGQAGLYTLTVTSSAGCSSTDVSTVTLISLPLAGIVSTNSLCMNTNLVLSGTGGTSYLWLGPNGFSSVLQNPVISSIPLAGDGVYSLSVTVGNCVGVTSKSIAVMPLPAITAANTSPACESKTFQLIVTGGIKWVWTGPNNFASGPNLQDPIFGSASPLNSGIYTVTITDGNNCQSTAYTSVIVNPIPAISAFGATVCSGTPGTLNATGGTTYQWIGPGGFSSTLSNPTIPQVTLGNNDGNYTIIVGSAFSCTSISSVNVRALTLPSPSLIVTPRACVNTSISLQAFGGLAYQWRGPSDFLTTQQNYVFAASSTGYNGVYTLTAFNAAGCAGYTTTSIIIDPLPDGSLNSSNVSRCVPYCGDFELSPLYSTPIVMTTWKLMGLVFQSDTFHYCASVPGDVLVTGTFTDANTCVNTSTFIINAYPVPIANFEYEPKNPVESTDLVLFTNTSSGEALAKWNWSFSDNNGYKTDSKNATYLFDGAGTFPISLIVKNAWGCSDTALEYINVDSEFIFFVPNAFTPNADGKNELFQPKGRGVIRYTFVIYDRWGEQLFSTSDFESGWDGTYKGKACMSGGYQWKIHAEDKYGKKKDLAGGVTLYR